MLECFNSFAEVHDRSRLLSTEEPDICFENLCTIILVNDFSLCQDTPVFLHQSLCISCCDHHTSNDEWSLSWGSPKHLSGCSCIESTVSVNDNHIWIFCHLCIESTIETLIANKDSTFNRCSLLPVLCNQIDIVEVHDWTYEICLDHLLLEFYLVFLFSLTMEEENDRLSSLVHCSAVINNMSYLSMYVLVSLQTYFDFDFIFGIWV